MGDVIPENAHCRNSPLLPPAFFFSFTKILSDSPLLASSIRCLVDELDDIRGHGKIIIDTSSHISHHQCLFLLNLNTRQRAQSTRTM